MGLRRDGREAAIQFLYQYDAHKPEKFDDVVPSMPFPPDDKDWKELDSALKKAREREGRRDDGAE